MDKNGTTFTPRTGQLGMSRYLSKPLFYLGKWLCPVPAKRTGCPDLSDRFNVIHEAIISRVPSAFEALHV